MVLIELGILAVEFQRSSLMFTFLDYSSIAVTLKYINSAPGSLDTEQRDGQLAIRQAAP